MAQLTQIESKLAEVMGLAQAAQKTIAKVRKLVKDKEVSQTLAQMQKEAAETEKRCAGLADGRDGKKTAFTRETRSEAEQMMRTYLSGEADALDGLEFMIMAEAGELGHVDIVQSMNKTAKDADVRELVKWVQPVQKRHVQQTRQAALALAAEEDPDEPAG